MSYILIIIFLFVQNVVFSSSLNQDQIDRANQIISNFKNDLEFASEPAKIQKFLCNICSKMKDDETSKHLLLDVCLFTLLKKFPNTFIEAITKTRKEFTLEAVLYPEYAGLCTIKKVKIYPENLLIIKYNSKDQEENEQINEIIGAKRFVDMSHMAIHDFIKGDSYFTDVYRSNCDNRLIWFAPENDSDDDSTDNNFEQEDYAPDDVVAHELGVGPFLVVQLYDGSIRKTKDDWTTLEDIIDGATCTFENGKLFFEQGENIIRTFNVLPEQDGRYVRRTKGDKIKYFFVEDEADPQNTKLLLFKKSIILIDALPVLRIDDQAETYRIIEFFKKYGIRDIRDAENENSLYIQSMHEIKYHQFTVERKNEAFFKNYTMNEYNDIYQGIVSQIPKEYPFSNWLKLRFFKPDDSTIPGILELLCGDELVPLPLDGVIDISSAKCVATPEDLISGTNIVFKTIDNKWYQFSTNEMIGTLV